MPAHVRTLLIVSANDFSANQTDPDHRGRGGLRYVVQGVATTGVAVGAGCVVVPHEWASC